MARWILVNGSEREIFPSGRIFTGAELDFLIDGNISGYLLAERIIGGIFLYMDDEGKLKGKRRNRLATELLHFYRWDLGQVVVYGNVLLADLCETGDA